MRKFAVHFQALATLLALAAITFYDLPPSTVRNLTVTSNDSSASSAE